MKVILIIDPQNDFINGTLAVPGAEMAMLDLSYWYRNHLDELGVTFVTLDTHPKNHCSFKENGGEWPVHCVDSTHGWEVYEHLRNILRYDEYFLKGLDPNKDEYSIFNEGNEDGEELLKSLNYLKDTEEELTIYIAGLAGDYCVANTIRDLINNGFKDNLVILTKCIASMDGGKRLETYIDTRNLKTE